MIDSLSKVYRGGRGVALLLIYSVVAALSLYLAYDIRFDFAVPPEHQQERIQVIWVVVGIKLVALLRRPSLLK